MSAHQLLIVLLGSAAVVANQAMYRYGYRRGHDEGWHHGYDARRYETVPGEHYRA